MFRTADHQVFALRDRCPHKDEPLSQGVVRGTRVVCPRHDWKVRRDTGFTVAPGDGCAARFPVRVKGRTVLLSFVTDAGCPNTCHHTISKDGFVYPGHFGGRVESF